MLFKSADKWKLYRDVNFFCIHSFIDSIQRAFPSNCMLPKLKRFFVPVFPAWFLDDFWWLWLDRQTPNQAKCHDLNSRPFKKTDWQISLWSSVSHTTNMLEIDPSQQLAFRGKHGLFPALALISLVQNEMPYTHLSPFATVLLNYAPCFLQVLWLATLRSNWPLVILLLTSLPTRSKQPLLSSTASSLILVELLLILPYLFKVFRITPLISCINHSDDL